MKWKKGDGSERYSEAARPSPDRGGKNSRILGGLLRCILPGGRTRMQSEKLFFACSGNGNGTGWNNVGSNGNYWSASINSAANARNLNFNSGGVNPQNNNNRFNGFSVRPVQHTLLAVIFFFLSLSQ